MTKVDRKKPNAAFQNGVPLLLVLKLLSRNEMYGYEIVKSIQKASNDVLSFAEGAIYPVLHLLEKDGFITSREQSINGRTRLYYSLTESGLKRLSELETEWARVSRGVSLALQWEPKS